MPLKPFAWLAVLLAIPIAAQNAPKSVALTGTSRVPPEEILKQLQKECPNVSIVKDATKSDYTLEAIPGYELTLFDHDGITVRYTSNTYLDDAAKDICRAIRTFVLVTVVDTQNLTQSQDTRTSGGIAGAVTGRRTLTDTSTISVIVNGEHALLDCYERRKGCTTIGPGKYYGEQLGDGIWVNYQMPITHKQVRNHYKIAGSW
jgi:hypothetical protein